MEFWPTKSNPRRMLIVLLIFTLVFWAYWVYACLAVYYASTGNSSCSPHDAICSSGDSFAGNIYWATMVSLIFSVPVWLVSWLLFFVVREIARKRAVTHE